MLKKSLLTLLIALTFVTGISKANAYSLEDAMADITSLKTQIVDLKSQLSAAVITSKSDTIVPAATTTPEVTPATTKTSLTFTSQKNITPNAKGDDVITLQTALKEAGYFTASVTGTYGAVTEKAVKAFQKDNNLPTTGVVGNLTKSLLMSTTGGQQKGSVSNCTIVLQSMTTPATQNVAVGTTNFNFAKFRAFSGCKMKLNTLKIVVGGTVAPNAIASSLTNLKVYVDGIQYGVTVNPVQGQNIITLNGPVFSANTVKTISLYADVIGGSGLTTKIGISNATGTSTQTGIPVVPYSGAIQYGQMMNIGTSCLSTATPSITVLSPNGGEVYTAGQQVIVKWTSCNVPNTLPVFISLEGNNNITTNIVDATQGVLNDGSELVTLPTQGTWQGMQFGQIYKIRVGVGPFGNLSGSTSDNSDNLFTINAAPTCTPSVTLNSPNGGEVFTVGQQITMTWQTNCFNLSVPLVGFDLAVCINNSCSNTFTFSANGLLNDGIETLTIPNSVSSGNNYKIRIYAYDPLYINPPYPLADYSDGLFTISSNPSLPTGCNSASGYSSVTGQPCWIITQSISSLNSTSVILNGHLFSGAPATITWNIIPSNLSLPAPYIASVNGPLSAVVTGLTPNTSYLYRVCALSPVNQYACTSMVSFQTFP